MPASLHESQVRYFRGLCCLLSLQFLLDFPSNLDPLQYALTVLVQLQLLNDAVRRMDADGYRLTRGFLADYTLNVDDVFETVDRRYFAFTAFVRTAGNDDFVVFPDWNGTNLWKKLGNFGYAKLSELLTLYFSRSSLLRGALIMVRRTLDGAP
jgi:hypothetical protein